MCTKTPPEYQANPEHPPKQNQSPIKNPPKNLCQFKKYSYLCNDVSGL